MIFSVTLHPDTYVDSVVQLSGTRALRAVDGVDWAAAAMATPANLESLAAEGFAPDDTAGAGVNDLFVAVRAGTDEAVAAAKDAGAAAMFSSRSTGAVVEQPPRTMAEALAKAPDANVAVISVPGDYAALEAHKALSAGLHVLLFSDNVPVEAEVALKARAARLGRLVMGPGAGTAMLGRTCLGFANVVSSGARARGGDVIAGSGPSAAHGTVPGAESLITGPVDRPRVAVVAAAGTGAQEAAALLDRWGVDVPHVIGLGGRDLTAAVGGRMALTAVAGLVADEGTDVILLVSKPPARSVAQALLAAAAGKPLVAAMIGLEPASVDVPEGVVVTRTLEAGAVAALAAVGLPAPDVVAGLVERVGAQIAGLPPDRTLVRGLFSGGTLCYESLVVLADTLGPVHSNTPIDKSLGLPAPAGAHTCLDLGEEEYTKGAPHPMIDPAARIELLREAGDEPGIAVIILDVVLGYGAHPDPAAELAAVCAEITAGGPRVVVYVLGTEGDPQGLAKQRRAFTDAGCLVTETAARASLAAAAIASRRPELAGTAL